MKKWVKIMKNLKPVLEIQDYGKVEIQLRQVLEKRGITRNQLARLTNTRFEVVDKWYSGNIERLDTDILARFCYTLNCSVSDIIKHKI